MSKKLDEIVNEEYSLKDEVIDMIKDSEEFSPTKAQIARWAATYGSENIESNVRKIYEENKHMLNFKNENAYNKMKALIRDKYKFIFNEVLDKSFYKIKGTQDWKLYESDLIIDYLKGEMGVRSATDKDVDVIVKSISENVNPIKIYFDKLPKWDGKTDYLKQFCECVDTDEPEWLYNMLKKNLVRTIKCAFESDYENRYLFILVGGQQSGKTKLIQFLNPFYDDRGYGKYHNHNPIKMGEKDAIIQSSKAFFWNIDEFEVLRGKEISHLKSIISQGNTTIRPAYSKHERDVIRRCSYFASTNRSEFLSDNENTRYICINVLNNKQNQIRWREYIKIGVDRIWSQIYSYYLDPTFKYELTVEEIKQQDEINNRYNVITYVSEVMDELYEAPKEGDTVEYLRLVDIKQDVEAVIGEKNIPTYPITDSAGRMGIPYKAKKINGKNIGKRYAVKRIGTGKSDFVPQHSGVWSE